MSITFVHSSKESRPRAKYCFSVKSQTIRRNYLLLITIFIPRIKTIARRSLLQEFRKKIRKAAGAITFHTIEADALLETWSIIRDMIGVLHTSFKTGVVFRHKINVSHHSLSLAAFSVRRMASLNITFSNTSCTSVSKTLEIIELNAQIEILFRRDARKLLELKKGRATILLDDSSRSVMHPKVLEKLSSDGWLSKIVIRREIPPLEINLLRALEHSYYRRNSPALVSISVGDANLDFLPRLVSLCPKAAIKLLLESYTEEKNEKLVPLITKRMKVRLMTKMSRRNSSYEDTVFRFNADYYYREMNPIIKKEDGWLKIIAYGGKGYRATFYLGRFFSCSCRYIHQE